MVHGMLSPRAPEHEFVQLERFGPYIPPITFPYGATIVTDQLRQRVQEEQFTGVSFRSVSLYHIVKLDWHLWDRNAEEPPEYPEGGEPENYLLNQPHSPDAASALGTLWQLVPSIVADAQRKGSKFYTKNYRGEDVCQGSRWGHTYVSQRFRDWLESEAYPWIDFTLAKTSPD
ncbi:MAG: hypothetical protein U0175_18530 [Caldilineaceae bacterium]